MPGITRTAVAATAVLVFLSACHRSGAPGADPAAAPRIELNLSRPGSGTVDVVGLPADDLSRLQRAALSREEWTALLRTAVASEAGAATDRPPVLGSYTITDGTLRFTPQFPFDPGQRYDVSLDPSHLPTPSGGPPAPWRLRLLETSIKVPAPEGHPTTRVVGVFPSATEVPENQLRLYISFSAPMGLAGGSKHVRLLDQTGRTVDDPFLPLDVDLWNDDRTRYTVLFDPGRVKRGILPNEEMGRSLIVGQKYTVFVDESWRDASGQPLAAPFRREFRVGPPEERAIDPATWRLEAPLESTRDPLVVSFPKPLDYGLLQRALTVSSLRGERVPGDIRLEAGETRWLFIPHAAWRAGEYRLLASSILEDVAGNRIGRPFEVEALASGRVETEATSAALPFRVVSGTLDTGRRAQPHPQTSPFLTDGVAAYLVRR